MVGISRLNRKQTEDTNLCCTQQRRRGIQPSSHGSEENRREGNDGKITAKEKFGWYIPPFKFFEKNHTKDC